MTSSRHVRIVRSRSEPQNGCDRFPIDSQTIFFTGSISPLLGVASVDRIHSKISYLYSMPSTYDIDVFDCGNRLRRRIDSNPIQFSFRFTASTSKLHIPRNNMHAISILGGQKRQSGWGICITCAACRSPLTPGSPPHTPPQQTTSRAQLYQEPD